MAYDQMAPYWIIILCGYLEFLFWKCSYIWQKSKSTSDVPSKVSKEVSLHKDDDLFSTEQVLKQESPPVPDNVPAYWV